MGDLPENADSDVPENLIASRMTPKAISLAEEYASSYHEALKVAADSARIIREHNEITEDHIHIAGKHLVSGEELGSAKDCYESLMHVSGLIVAIPIAVAFVRLETWWLSATMFLLGLLLVVGAHALRADNRRDVPGFLRSLWSIIWGT